MDNQQIIARTLDDIMHNYPYNIMASVYRHAEQQVDNTLGGNCIDMSRRIAEILGEHDIETSYLRSFPQEGDRFGRHYAVCAKDGADLFYLDATLLMKKPVNLAHAVNNDSHSVCVDAYPLSQTVSLGYNPHRHLMAVSRSIRIGGILTQNRTLYEFDVNQHYELPEHTEDWFIYHPEQKNLFIMVFETETESTIMLTYSVNNARKMSPSKEHLKVRISHGKLVDCGQNPVLFVEGLRRMCNVLHCSPESLKEFMLEGVRLYRKNLPNYNVRVNN